MQRLGNIKVHAGTSKTFFPPRPFFLPSSLVLFFCLRFGGLVFDKREKGLYACTVGGLPLFTSGWKLEPRPEDDCPR